MEPIYRRGAGVFENPNAFVAMMPYSVHYQTQTKWDSVGGSYPAPFDQRFHLLFNLAFGGDFVGPTNGQTVFPQQMQIDWVRVYSLTP